MASPGIGLMISPFVMDALGKKMGLDKVLSLNIKGAKLYNKETGMHLSGYISSCKDISIYPDFVWRDDQEENLFWINKLFHRLKKDGRIIKESAEIMRCSCGAVESLSGAENLLLSRRVYRNEGNKKYCNLCNSEIRNSRESVYLFCFPSFGEIKTFPKFYSKDLMKMTEKFAGFKFLVSRLRPSSLILQNGKEKIFLDVDFAWQMFLPLLRRLGYNPSFLIGSAKNIMACCFAAMMLKLIDGEEVNVIIPPYYLAPRKGNLKGNEYALSSLLQQYDVKTMRLLLSTAMNWNGKESVLDIGLANLISKMAYRINSKEGEICGIEEAISDFNGTNIKTLLSVIRKNRKVFFCKELFGIV